MSVVEARFNGVVIARSEHTILLEGKHYFPPWSFEPDYLRRSRATSLCPWKDIASYYTIDVDGAGSRNAARACRHPSPLARRIKNHVAFWGGVEVVDSE